MDSRCACPPDSFSVRVAARSDMPTSSSMAPARPAGTPYSAANLRNCSRADRCSKNDDAWSWTPILGSSAGLRGHGAMPSTLTSPPSGRRSPSMISSAVVLPAPLCPKMPKNSPRPTSNVTPSTARRPP
jgi:hypothetical protein